MSADDLAVTVVVPVRDGADFVADCLASLLAQEGGPPTVVVVDDGSRDDTAAVAARAEPSVVVLRRPPRGVSAARNTGIRHATTPLIAFCDADDRWPPDRLREDRAILAADPSVDAVLGHARLQPDDPALLGLQRARPGDVVLLHSFCGVTVRREVFDRVGLLDESLAHYEDYDWFLRIREAGVSLVVRPGVAFERRLRADSVSHLVAPGPTALLVTLKRSLDRRREAGSERRPLPQLSELPAAPPAARPAARPTAPGDTTGEAER